MTGREAERAARRLAPDSRGKVAAFRCQGVGLRRNGPCNLFVSSVGFYTAPTFAACVAAMRCHLRERRARRKRGAR